MRFTRRFGGLGGGLDLQNLLSLFGNIMLQPFGIGYGMPLYFPCVEQAAKDITNLFLAGREDPIHPRFPVKLVARCPWVLCQVVKNPVNEFRAG